MSVSKAEEPLTQKRVCAYCLTADCDSEPGLRAIRMHHNIGYEIYTCAREAKRIQDAETLKQQGIHTDLVASLWRLSGIPQRFKECSLQSFQVDRGNGEAMALAIDITNNFAKYEKTGRGLVLLGPKGVGKTHLLCAVLHRLIERGVPATYAYAPDFLAMLRDRSKDSTLLDITFRELAKTHVLAIDDIGVDKDSAWTIAQYTRLLDGRYRNNRVTLFASNLGMEDLRGVLGERVMSRLIEANEIVEIRGKDRRMECVR